MKLAICTIQRNRGPWLKEWFAFHYAVGFRKFYFFAHKCTDNTAHVILEMKKHFDIEAFVLGEDLARPQLSAYQHAYQNFNHEVDWMAFIDGDEFLFPTQHHDLREVLDGFSYKKMSALAAYWACFGSSGHLTEPEGLVTENYRFRAPFDFETNRHVKSIVMGRQGPQFAIQANAHHFKTIHGTFDTAMRPINGGLTTYEPTYDLIRINHYVTQSLEYFRGFKQTSGAADVNPHYVRPNSWWEKHDRNDVFDESLIHLTSKVAEVLASIND
jgi:hypothetical protein